MAFPEHFAEPTVAMPVAFDSDRPAEDVVDDVLAAVGAIGRDSVAIMGLGDLTRPEGLEAHLVDRGATLRETLAVLALDLTKAPPTWRCRVTSRCVPSPTCRPSGTTTGSGWRSSAAPCAPRRSWRRRSPPSPTAAATRCWWPTAATPPLGTGGYTVAGDVLRLWGGAVVPEARGTGVYRAVLDHRLRAGRALGCRVALVKGRVDTSAPVLRRAGFATYGEEAYLTRP